MGLYTASGDVMIQPIQNVVRVVCLSWMPRRWSFNHDDGQMEFASRQNFCFSARTARVSGNNNVNLKFVKKLQFLFDRKWAAIIDDIIVLKWYWLTWWINETQEIKVARAYSDCRQMSSPDCQKYPSYCTVKSDFQIFEVTYIAPLVFGRFCPWWAGQGKNGNVSYFAGGHSVRTYLDRKWVSCVNHMRNFLCFDKVDQAFCTPKSAGTNRPRLRCRTGDTACERNGARHPCDFQFSRQRCCLGCPAEQKYIRFDD